MPIKDEALFGVRHVAYVYEGADRDIENFFINAAKDYINNLVEATKADVGARGEPMILCNK